LGYVGLPLGVAFAEEGLDVAGVDVDSTRIARIAVRQGRNGASGDEVPVNVDVL
jgi:UDP-N-acetyl-D-mannosaminuronate dehydrogenase